MNNDQTQSQSGSPLEENKLTPQAGPVDSETGETPASDPFADTAGNGEVQPDETDPIEVDEDEDAVEDDEPPAEEE